MAPARELHQPLEWERVGQRLTSALQSCSSRDPGKAQARYLSSRAARK